MACDQSKDCVHVDFIFRCSHCIRLIGPGSPVYMGHDHSYCSMSCRRRGRSSLYSTLRDRRLDSLHDFKRQSSVDSGTSLLSSALSESSSGSSISRSDKKPGPLGWVISKVFNVISNRLPESLAVHLPKVEHNLCSGLLMESASAALLKQFRRGSSLQRIAGYFPEVGSMLGFAEEWSASSGSVCQEGLSYEQISYNDRHTLT
eukprot:TRINITY_DN74180_c0_g1_i1.p1 TRINITY_DN74180_c0_g1~~TRINITY_DN74180_c0_g1_i1.p1  ORF type:complete len:203 (-),score=17.32 TRINITY_DN74180_c0_g1_i1:50-658(-)